MTFLVVFEISRIVNFAAQPFFSASCHVDLAACAALLQQ
jgi:hypothetical protein